MLNTCLQMRVAHVRRHDVILYNSVVKPPKPGVSRWRTIREWYNPSRPEQPCGLIAMTMLI